jgi:cytochrome c oxidase assembly protein subunit 15
VIATRATQPERRRAADILTLGFATTLSMWTVGYACRLFGDAVPAPLIFVLLLLCLMAGGVVAGRYTDRGVRGGLWAGLLSGGLNLLIVGSLIGAQAPNALKVGAWTWVTGSLGISVALGVCGALIGRQWRSSRPEPDWRGGLAIVAACATFLLLAAGGLVTGFDEGLAVVDWPNTEGYNMFLYPLARMTGGVYLEHAHRLLGSLVGLTTLVMALHIQRSEPRRWVRRVAWLALLFVILQGVLGGLRVTGRLTWSTRAADTDPKILLAIVHGIFGQVVFATLVALAVWRSRAWQTAPPPTAAPSASTDRTFGVALVALVIVQLMLGALVRHFSWALDILRYGLPVDPKRLVAIGQRVLHVHIAVAVLVVVFGITVGVRAWGLYRDVRPLHTLGSRLLLLLGVQLALGIFALAVSGTDAPDRRPTAFDVLITTAHQVVGAAVLAWAVMLLLWNYRRLCAPARAARAVNSSPAPYDC